MEIIEINDNLLAALHLRAAASERKRMHYDLRTTAEDDGRLWMRICIKLVLH